MQLPKAIESHKPMTLPSQNLTPHDPAAKSFICSASNWCLASKRLSRFAETSARSRESCSCLASSSCACGNWHGRRYWRGAMTWTFSRRTAPKPRNCSITKSCGDAKIELFPGARPPDTTFTSWYDLTLALVKSEISSPKLDTSCHIFMFKDLLLGDVLQLEANLNS